MTGRQRATQTMKPATAAKKLGVHLDATPAEFRDGVVSRDEFDALQADPPEWLRELRRDGPHPRPVVADRLGGSISGLARAQITAPPTPAPTGRRGRTGGVALRAGPRRDHRATDHRPDRRVEGGAAGVAAP